MNPLALLLLAAAAGGGKKNVVSGPPVKLDTVLEHLHGAVNTLEKVNELSRIGASLPGSSLPAPSSAHVPASVQPVEEPEYSSQSSSPVPASPAPNFDIQGAIQTLGPILSMLGNSQNSR